MLIANISDTTTSTTTNNTTTVNQGEPLVERYLSKAGFLQK